MSTVIEGLQGKKKDQALAEARRQLKDAAREFEPPVTYVGASVQWSQTPKTPNRWLPAIVTAMGGKGVTVRVMLPNGLFKLYEGVRHYEDPHLQLFPTAEAHGGWRPIPGAPDFSKINALVEAMPPEFAAEVKSLVEGMADKIDSLQKKLNGALLAMGNIRDSLKRAGISTKPARSTDEESDDPSNDTEE